MRNTSKYVTKYVKTYIRYKNYLLLKILNKKEWANLIYNLIFNIINLIYNLIYKDFV